MSAMQRVFEVAELCHLYTYKSTSTVQLRVVLRDGREFVETAASEEIAYKAIAARL